MAIRSVLLPRVANEVLLMAPQTMRRFGYPESDFEVWQRTRGESEEIGRVVSEVEERTKDLELALHNVRVISRDEALRRIVCLADLRLGNGNHFDIRYLAQFNEAGELYVEVELLE